MNMGMQISFWVSVFISFGYIPRSGISGSYGNSIFNFLSALHTVFYNGCTNLQSHQQCMRFPISPDPHQHLLPLVFFIMMTLRGVRWYLIVALICISLITSVFNHHVIWCEKLSFHMKVPVGLSYIFFGKMSIQILCPFLNWVICFFAIELKELFIYFEY